jgi:hypothetical protein
METWAEYQMHLGNEEETETSLTQLFVYCNISLGVDVISRPTSIFSISAGSLYEMWVK